MVRAEAITLYPMVVVKEKERMFFAAHKAGKPWKRTHKRKGKGDQSANMVVNAPDPSMAVRGSIQEPEAPTPLGAGDSVPLLWRRAGNLRPVPSTSLAPLQRNHGMGDLLWRILVLLVL